MDQDTALPVTAVQAPEARSYPKRPILAASLAVFRRDRVLLARRAKPPLAGRYSLPGGLVEPGERLADAALREMREEVEVDARIVGFNQHVEVIERDYGNAVCLHYVIASFVGIWVAGEGTPGSEADDVVWARLDEIETLPVTDHLLPILQAATRLIAAERHSC